MVNSGNPTKQLDPLLNSSQEDVVLDHLALLQPGICVTSYTRPFVIESVTVAAWFI